jgi:hypothetical protein
MRSLGRKQLGAQITAVLRGVRGAALARLSDFEELVGWKETLMVGGAALGFLSPCL